MITLFLTLVALVPYPSLFVPRSYTSHVITFLPIYDFASLEYYSIQIKLVNEIEKLVVSWRLLL